MKRALYLSVCLLVLLAIFVFRPMDVQAASASDLYFTLNEDGKGYTVTDCNYSTSGTLEIPATYNGLPVTAIGEDALAHADDLTSVIIPDSVTTIGTRAFASDDSLKSVTIGKGVTSIGDEAFYYCEELTSIKIPDNVTSIGEEAFYACSNLQSVTLGEGVTSIGEGAFSGCTSLNNVIIPDSVTRIGKRAFSTCTSLENIVLPNGVTIIDDYAFYGCEALKSVVLGNSVTNIGGSAFYICDNLESIVIPSSVTRIESSAFWNCDNLNHVLYSGTALEWASISFEYCNDPLEEAPIHYNAVCKTSLRRGTLSKDGSITRTCTACGQVICVTPIKQPTSFTLSATSYVYNGKTKTPAVTVKDSTGKILTKDKDYTVTYESGRVNVGTYDVTIKMMGNYYGTKTLTFTIKPIDVSTCKVSLSKTSYTYDGGVKTPSVTVKNAAGKTLTKDTDYTVTYSTGRKSAGTYKVTVKMKGKYTGTKTLTFKIKPIDISKCKISLSKTSYTYNGKVQTPSVTVKTAAGTTLKKDTHYTVSYASGRTKAGTYKVTIKMKGNYTGTKTLTYKIKPADISKCKISLSKTSYTYNGKVQTPSVTVKNADGKTLKKDTDYTVSYSTGRKSAGTYKVTIKMKGNYTGTKTLTYKIKPIDISKCKVSLSKTSYAYNGKVQTPSVVVKNANGSKLKKDTDYTVTYSTGRTKAGTYKVTIKMKGNYTGTKTLTYKIKPADISKCKVSLPKTSYAYNGKAQTPSVTVKTAAGKTLKKNTDYTVTYSTGRKNVGTYKVTIKMRGNYTGTKTLTYKIAPTVKTPASLWVGSTYSIGAKSNTTIKYTTSNKSVATVSAKGVITAVKAGTATITVTSGKISQKIKVTVSKPSISIYSAYDNYGSGDFFEAGDSMQFYASTNPSNARVKWSVSNTSVATISSSGVLKARKIGKVTVTGSITYGGKTYKSSKTIEVSADFPEVTIFTSHDTDCTSSYGFTITNNGDTPLKILARGTAYCDGHSESIDSLFIGDGSYYSSITLKAGGSCTMLAVLEDYMWFWSSDPSRLDIYVEYKGELFRLECQSSRSGFNKLYRCVWIVE